jgi:hypothetical protein
MVKLDEETKLKPERINSNILNSSSLPSSDKEIEIQVYPYQDRQYDSVQHQQKIGNNNLYRMSRKIWTLSNKNCLQLKVAHIPERINVTTDKLSRLEMSSDYHLKEVFQMIQWIPEN